MAAPRTIPTRRPQTVVTYQVKIGGSEVPQQFRAESITVQKEANRIAAARLVFVDGSAAEGRFDASNTDLFVPGKEIEILAGYESDNHLLFRGVIVKHAVKIRSNNSILSIDCRDKAVRLTIGRNSRYFTNTTDSDAFAALMGAYPIVHDLEQTTVVHKELVQFDATDWDFLVSRAEANGQLCYVDDGKVSVRKPDLAASPVLSLLYGATILELDAEIDARHQHKSVQVKSWNSDTQEMVSAEAADPAVQLNGNLTTAALARVAGPETYVLQHGGSVGDAEMQAWANAFWWKHQVARVRGRVRFKGIHTVKPGSLIELGGVSDRFNGKCFVSGVQHFISAGDWQTDAQLGISPELFTEQFAVSTPPAGGMVPAVSGLQVGKVTQLEGDPEGRQRIRVFLPVISNNDQGAWVRVATLDAGNERGSFFLPEIGDEVIIGFINDDPRDAVVLGMMNSSAKPAPLPAQDANDKKGWVTRSKMKMIFNDADKSYTVETPGGKKIILDENAKLVKLEDEHGNRIEMNPEGIVIESSKQISIKAGTALAMEGVNVSAKASATLKATGGASAELSASGATTVKGGMVQIN